MNFLFTESVDYVGINAWELDFLPGSAQNSTACFNVVILNDTDIELPETFSVILIQTDAAVQLSSQYATAVVTIPLNPADSECALCCTNITNCTKTHLCFSTISLLFCRGCSKDVKLSSFNH